MRQFDQWIGGGHRFWHPRCAVLAERGGREGSRERRALAGMDLGASRYSLNDASHVEPRGAQANRAHLNFVMP